MPETAIAIWQVSSLRRSEMFIGYVARIEVKDMVTRQSRNKKPRLSSPNESIK